MNRRMKELIDTCELLLQAHDEWVANENEPNPTSTYWDAVDEVLLAFERGDIPAECRGLAELVERLAIENDRFNARNDDTGEQYPHDDFFAAVQAIRQHLNGVIQVPLKPLETIKELVEQKVSHEQIAKIYGFTDRRGNVLPWLVQRELDKPNSVLNTSGAIDGRDWRDPRLPPVEDSSPEDERLVRKSKAAADDQKPCPELPRELWEQKVPAKQAAKMLRRSVTEVEELFAGFELEREQDRANGESSEPSAGKKSKATASAT